MSRKLRVIGVVMVTVLLISSPVLAKPQIEKHNLSGGRIEITVNDANEDFKINMGKQLPVEKRFGVNIKEFEILDAESQSFKLLLNMMATDQNVRGVHVISTLSISTTDIAKDGVKDVYMNFDINPDKIDKNTTKSDIVLYKKTATGWSQVELQDRDGPESLYSFKAKMDSFSKLAFGYTVSSIKMSNPSLSSDSVSVGEDVTVTTDLANKGQKSIDRKVELKSNGKVVDEKTVSLGPDETRQVKFRHSFDSSGAYSIKVDDLSAGNLMVTEESQDQTGSDSGTDTGEGTGEDNASQTNASASNDTGDQGQPGFGIVLAMASLLAAVAAARRFSG
ncbi:MAG: PGF-CTERM sorting domain-containing protein [Halobacteria archaeon]